MSVAAPPRGPAGPPPLRPPAPAARPATLDLRDPSDPRAPGRARRGDQGARGGPADGPFRPGAATTVHRAAPVTPAATGLPPLRPPAGAGGAEPRPDRPARPPRRLRAVGQPEVDPRLAARRDAVAREARDRRLHRLLGVLAALAVLCGAALATRTPLLDVDAVVVEGTDAATAAAVVAAAAGAGGSVGDPMVSVDEGEIAAAVVAAVPAVAAATVQRDWPGGIVVAVTPRTPVAAAVGAPATPLALVDAGGVVIAQVPAAPAGLPLLEGVDATAAPGTVLDAPALLAVVAALPPDVAPAVAAVVAGEDGQVELRLAAGGAVLLDGARADLDQQLEAAGTVLARVDLQCLARIDVRVATVAAVTRQPGCVPGAPGP